MVNIEGTNFTELKEIVKNVDAIYEVIQDWGGECEEAGDLQNDLIPFLEGISASVFKLLGSKKELTDA